MSETNGVEWFDGASRKINHTPEWKTIPCICIGKHYITINDVAVQTFGLREGDLLVIGLHDDILHLKIAESDHEVAISCEIKNKTEGKSTRKVFGADRLLKALFRKGIEPGDYALRLSHGQRLWTCNVLEPLRVGFLNAKATKEL